MSVSIWFEGKSQPLILGGSFQIFDVFKELGTTLETHKAVGRYPAMWGIGEMAGTADDVDPAPTEYRNALREEAIAYLNEFGASVSADAKKMLQKLVNL